MRHTVDWTTGFIVAVVIFLTWITLCDWIEHINRLVSITKPFI